MLQSWICCWCTIPNMPLKSLPEFLPEREEKSSIELYNSISKWPMPTLDYELKRANSKSLIYSIRYMSNDPMRCNVILSTIPNQQRDTFLFLRSILYLCFASIPISIVIHRVYFRFIWIGYSWWIDISYLIHYRAILFENGTPIRHPHSSIESLSKETD